MKTRTVIGVVVSILAMMGIGLTAPAALAAPRTPEAPEPAAGVMAASCASWTRFVTGTGYHVNIPSTTRNGAQTGCVLRVGNQGPGVFVLQDALRRCYAQKIALDAIYGPNTRDAVRAVQAFHGFKPQDIDGVYGPQTRAVMTFPKYRNSDDRYDHCWR